MKNNNKKFKKIFVVLLFFFFVFNCFVFVEIPKTVSGGYVIDGDIISWENKYGKLSVSPVTSYQLIRQKQYANLTWKWEDTSITIAFGFDNPLVYGKMFYKNVEGNWSQVSGFSHIVYEGQDFYVYDNFNAVMSKTYELYWEYDIPLGSSGKWDLYVKKSIDSWLDAFNNNRFIHLDPWWNSNWGYKRKITIDKDYIKTDLVNFPVLVKINSSIISKADDGSSIRFVDSSESVEYYYEIEDSWNLGGYSYIWVNISSISSSSDTVFYIYYNNSLANDNQNPHNVWNTNFRQVFHMGSTSTLVKNDSSSSDNDLYSVDYQSSVSGLSGYCVDLEEGSGDDLNDNDPTQGESWNTYTMEMWCRPESMSSQMYLQMNDAIPDIYTYVLPAGSFYSTGGASTGSGLISINNWCYVVNTGNGSLSDLYVDSIYRVQSSSTCDYVNTDSAWGIEFGDSKFFDGLIDEIRVSDICRNASWIKASYYTFRYPNLFMIIGDEQNYSTLDVPTDIFASTKSNYINLTWVNGTNATHTYIERNTVDTWNRGSGTLVFNDTYDWFDDYGVSNSTLYYYQFWSYNSTSNTFGGSNITFNITSPGNPTGMSGIFDGASTLDIGWIKGDYADKTVIVMKEGNYPNTISDGTLIYNNTGSSYSYNSHVTDKYYKLWSWNETVHKFSEGTNLLWGNLVVNVFDASNGSNVSSWKIIITNHEGTSTYVNNSASNPCIVSTEELPFGDKTMILVNKSGYADAVYYMDLTSDSYTLDVYLLNSSLTYSYLISIVDEVGSPIEDAKLIVKGLVNSTSFENLSIGYSDGNGQYNLFLIPGQLYKINLSKDGYVSSTSNFIPHPPDTYGFTQGITLMLYHTGTTGTTLYDYNEVIVFNGYIGSGFVHVNYSDSLGYMIDVAFYIYDFDNSTGVWSLVNYYPPVSSSSLSFNFTGVNTSRDHIVVMYLNHTYFDNWVDSFSVTGIRTTLTSVDEFNDIFTNVFGNNSFGWSAIFGLFIMMVCLFSFGEAHAGISLMMMGFVMLGFNYLFGLALVSVSICSLVIILGVFVQWRVERRRIS